MRKTELSLVYFVAKLSPWIAPIPSSFFVARSCMQHLNLPWFMALIIGFVIESLGLTSIHTCLLLQNWNYTKRKSDPKAPFSYALALVFVYLFSTIGLSISLDMSKELVKFSPALFPILSLVGSFNIALISQQEHREMVIQNERREMQKERQNRRQLKSSNITKSTSNLGENNYFLNMANETRKEKREQILNTILDILKSDPNIGITDLARKIGRSRQSIYNYLSDLEAKGIIYRNDNGVSVTN